MRPLERRFHAFVLIGCGPDHPAAAGDVGAVLSLSQASIADGHQQPVVRLGAGHTLFPLLHGLVELSVVDEEIAESLACVGILGASLQMLAEKLDATIDLALPGKLHGLFSRGTRLSPRGDWCGETDGGDEEHVGEVRLHDDTPQR